MSLLKRILLVGTAAVAASTVTFPWIHYCGTGLYLIIVLLAWGIVARFTSQTYADLHHGPGWFMALLLNLGLFLLPALAIFYASGKHRPWLGVLGLSSWLAFYLLSLFLLFPVIHCDL